ncbi:MAG: hypothetical protein AB7E29_11900 [Xanthobacter sp.]
MSSMRPDTNSTPRLFAPRHSATAWKGALVIVALSCLAACSEKDRLTLPLPPAHPNVANVEHDQYPTVGTTESTGGAVLKPQQRVALERELAISGKQNGRSIESRLEAESAANAEAY